MDSTHLHLLLNHFPIIGTLIGVGVMFYAYLIKSPQTKNAALWTWLLMAVVAIPVFLTGEPAEERVEGLAGVSETLLEEHEESAKLAFWVMEALGVFSLISLILAAQKHAFAKTAVTVTFALSIFTFGLMARTGYIGGQVRHSEIRSDAANQGQPENTGGEQEIEDDD